MSARKAPLAAGRDRGGFVASRCGNWLYEQADVPGAPCWEVTFRPTGQVTRFGSLARARQWTASPGALADLRRVAQAVVDAGGRRGVVRFPLDGYGRRYRFEVPEDDAECAARVAAARRQVEVLDRLAGRGSQGVTPRHRCHPPGKTNN